MMDNNENALNIDKFQAALQYALLEIEQENIEQSVKIWDELEKEPPVQPSLEFQQNMKNFFRSIEKSDRKQHRARARKRRLRYVAMILIIVIGTVSVLAVTSEAFRGYLKKIFQFSSQEYVGYWGDFTDQDLLAAGFTYKPTYIPAGYHLSVLEPRKIRSTMIFDNPEGKTITIYQSNTEQRYYLDNELEEMRPLDINGVQGTLKIDDDRYNIHWSIDEYFFTLIVPSDGTMAEEDIVSIAQSLHKIKTS